MAKPINIVQRPEHRPRLFAKAVETTTADLTFLKEMADTARETPTCIGLASNQIWDKDTPPPAVILVRMPDGSFKEFFNPRNVKLWGNAPKLFESCLSVPGKKHKVKRWNRITLTYEDMSGKTLTESYMGPVAQILQHEIDHLNGKLL